MKLQKLALTHFRGQTNFVLDAQGKNVTIYADNGIGKTTIADAFFWGIFGKDSKGNALRKEVKHAPDGKAISGLNTIVELVFDIDGKQVSLLRDFHEEMTKKRGEGEAKFDGHTTEYRFNTVPLNATEYEKKITEICDKHVLRMLTDPFCFSKQLKWQERRVMLLEICGDVTTEDVIASDSALKPLGDALEGREIEDFRKIKKAEKDKTGEAKKNIPTRLDEARRALPVIDSTEPVADLELLNKDLAALQQKQLTLAEGGAVTAKRTRQGQIKLELQRIEHRLQKDARGDMDETDKELRAKRSALSELEFKIERASGKIAEAEGLIAECETARAKLREEFATAQAKTFEFTGDTTCVTCGQDLPVGKLAEIKEKAEARFNHSKATEISDISTKGLAKKSYQETLEAGKKTKSEELEVLRDQAATLKTEIEALDEKLKGVEAPEVDLSADPGAKVLIAESEALEAEIVSLQEGNEAEQKQIADEIRTVTQRITFAQGRKAQEAQRENGTKRIKELETEQQGLAANLEQQERMLFLVEQFVRAKVRMLTEKINSKFDLVAFKLFDEQNNGGLNECCEATFEGRPYSDLSTAECINVGLDIINTLSRHYGFAPPIFIDNTESINHIIPTEGQQIRLRVSTDKALRVEIAEEARELAGAF
jgi:DNA repair exonuclease SbcCD ATPase subunit